MARNLAIAIGVNTYEYLEGQALAYAERDAQAIGQYLRSELAFEQVHLFTDTSPPVNGRSTRPVRPNVLLVLDQVAASLRLSRDDSLWFFFSGHGGRQRGQDYLLLADSYWQNLPETAIPTERIIRSLLECQAGNLVLLLDMCRNVTEYRDKGMGSQTIELAKQKGVITLFSCSPGERSYEIEALGQGVFTHALLTAFQTDCHPSRTTVQCLDNHLRAAVPALNGQFGLEPQVPYIVPEPGYRYQQILLPTHTEQVISKPVLAVNIDRLKAEALQARYVDQDLDRAEQLYDLIIEHAHDPQERRFAAQQIREITQAKLQHSPHPVRPEVENKTAATAIPQERAPEKTDLWGGHPARPEFENARPDVENKTAATAIPQEKQKSETKTAATAIPQEGNLQTFSFDVITVDRKGKETNRRTEQAKFWVEDLGQGVTLEMVLIPGGEFEMGSNDGDNDEKPVHTVRIKPFLMGKFPVTQAQWQVVAALPKIDRDLEPDPANFKGANRPVECVSWYDAVEFCQRLAAKTGKDYRLPSEAEWEYACRAGTSTPFHFGETLTTDLANYKGEVTYADGPKGIYRKETTDVGSFPPNALGLYDMHGNVWEWCADHWHDNYQGAPTDGSVWLSSDEQAKRSLRGGSWIYPPRDCRSAYRLHIHPGYGSRSRGFRVVLGSLPRTA